tara:strand:- start:130 stop:348 length:219 start_codon:yes stop_codon:yes gene_type:complete
MSMNEAKVKQLFGTADFANNDALLAMAHAEYAGNPTNNLTPTHAGKICHDTTNDDWYISHGTAASEWKIFAT